MTTLQLIACIAFGWAGACALVLLFFYCAGTLSDRCDRPDE